MAKSKYSKYLVRKPVYETGPPDRTIKGRQMPTMTYMSNALVPGSNMYIEFGWIWDIPEPNPHVFEHTHDFNEIVIHYGGDPDNPEDLGGEIEFCVSGQPLLFDTTTALFVPKGVKHGPLTWKKFKKPHIELAMMLGAGSIEEGWSRSGISTPQEELSQKTGDIDYEKYLVRRPVREVGVGAVGSLKGRQVPSMTYMSNALVPGCNTYIEFSWIWDMPEPNPHIHEHSHEYDEIVLHIGSDPNNPEDLGGELEYVVGGEPLVFDTTTALFVPRGVKHGPLTWKRVDRPHLEMVIILGTGDFALASPGRSQGE